VIPQHYNKAECIIKLTKEAIECEDTANYLLNLRHNDVAKIQQS